MADHPKDLCTCGHKRSLHKNGTGACAHRHASPCNGFQLAEAHVILSPLAYVLLADLVETNEPVEACDPVILEELYAHGFISYIREGWVGSTPAGQDYSRDNRKDIQL